jgi:hypothetical protein
MFYKMSSTYKLIFFLLIAWLITTSFLYFDNLIHYPKSYVEYFNMGYIRECFSYIDDIDRKEEALDYARSHGRGAEAEMYLDMGLRFLKPIFSLNGYIKLLFLPLVIIWILFVLCF